jgi:hypothetical protein
MLKITSLFIGVAWLIWGALYENIIDWDIGISLIMTFFTWASAEWFIRVFRTLNWKMMIPALLVAWWSVDGCYIVYWAFKNPDALVMREASIYPSMLFYLLCGVIWSALGTLDLHLSLRKTDQSQLN